MLISDGVGNAWDNCPKAWNPGQEDADSDGVGDDCDNCRYTANPHQDDSDSDCPETRLCGRVDCRSDRDEIAVVAADVLPLEEARDRFTTQVSIVLKTGMLNNGEEERVRMLLNKFPGECPVVLQLKTGTGEELVLKSKKFRVRAVPALLADLRVVLGKENVWIEG